MLADLRVPFMPGALNAAIEDLEKVIADEGGRDAAGAARSGVRPTGAGSNGKGGANVWGGRNKTARFGQHGGLSFVSWYGWWVRHLPYDPASTSCLLKTVRCALAMHAAEMAAAREVLKAHNDNLAVLQ